MAYHQEEGKTVLFGGQRSGWVSVDSGVPSDTWIWDGITWTQVDSGECEEGGSSCREVIDATCEEGGSPCGRKGHAMAYHPASGKVVMFGGFISQEPFYLSDTWTFDFDGTQWEWNQVTPQSSPPARWESALAESPPAEPGPDRKNDVVLFGGGGSSGSLGDTWIWDGANWLEKEPPPGSEPASEPGGRSGHEMGYHRSLGLTVLFGGSGPAKQNETWTWDGTSWTERKPERSPAGSPENGMAYHAGTQRVVIFGSTTGDSVEPVGETWTWPGAPSIIPDAKVPPDLPDIRDPYDLVLEPDSIPANGDARSTATASFFIEGKHPVQGERFRFSTPGDLAISPTECTTGPNGKCSVTITASLTPGEEEVTATSSSSFGASAILTERDECPPPSSPGPSSAWWANLDPSFGCNGKVVSKIHRFGSTMSPTANDMAVDKEGKIVVLTNYVSDLRIPTSSTAGQEGREYNSYLVRYQPDGKTLDTSFGPNRDGVTAVDGWGRNLEVQDHDGKLVVSSIYGPVLQRFNTDGSRDDGFGTRFGTRGIVEPGGLGGVIAIQKDRKILVWAERTSRPPGLPVDEEDTRFCCLYRYNEDGTLDDGGGADSTKDGGFGTGGRVHSKFLESGRLSAVEVQDDGLIVIGGAGVARLLPDGQPDTSFNPCPSPDMPCGGCAEGPGGSVATFAFDEDKRIIAAGGTSEAFTLARYRPNGTLDPDFNPCPAAPPCGGKVKTGQFPGWQRRARGPQSGDGPEDGGWATSVVVETDGRIIAAGAGPNGEAADFLLARYNPDGTLDDGCGTPGKARTRFGYDSGIVNSAIQVTYSDTGEEVRRIVAGGYLLNYESRGGGAIAIARYMGGGPQVPPSEVTVVGSTVNEPRAGQRTDAPFEITLRLDAPACQPISFDYQTRDESAKAGADYTPTKGQVMFRPGEQEKKVSVAVLPDQVKEDPETFALEVSNPVGLSDPTNPRKLRLPVKIAEGQAEIIDEVPTIPNPQNAAPKLSISDTSAIEGNTPGSKASFIASLDKPAPEAVTFTYSTTPGTAASPQDFTHTTNTATIEKAKTQTTVPIDITPDTIPEPAEVFELLVSAPKGATLGRQTAQAVIYDDDQGPAASSQAPPRPSAQTAVPAGLAVHAANLPPPSLAQGTQIQASQQAQQQMQQQAQQQLQAQVMAGMMTERQRQAEVAKQGLSDKDAYLASARRQTAPAFAKAFAFIAAMIAFGAAMAYSRTRAPEVARNKARLPARRRSI